MLMLNLLGHSCLIIMFYLNLYLFFRVAFIFMVCSFLPLCPLLRFPWGMFSIDWASYSFVFISVMAVCFLFLS